MNEAQHPRKGVSGVHAVALKPARTASQIKVSTAGRMGNKAATPLDKSNSFEERKSNLATPVSVRAVNAPIPKVPSRSAPPSVSQYLNPVGKSAPPIAAQPRVLPTIGRTPPTLSAMSPLKIGKVSARHIEHASCMRCGKSGPAADFSMSRTQCNDCVKRKLQPASLRPIFLFAVIALVILVAVGIFLPSQALLVGLLSGIASVLTGVAGYTLSRTTRLAALAGGLLTIALTSYGLIAVGQSMKNKAARTELAGQADEIKRLLAKNCFVEAELRIGAIEQQTIKLSPGESSEVVTSAVAELRSLTRGWIEHHYGKLSSVEEKLLIDLFRNLGSLTPSTQALRVHALSVSGGTNVAVTIATDTQKPAWKRATDDPQSSVITINDDPLEAEATRVLLLIDKNFSTAENVDVKLISGKGEQELVHRTFSRQEIAVLRQKLSHPRAQPVQATDVGGPPKVLR